MYPYPDNVDVLPIVKHLLAYLKGQGDAKIAANDLWTLQGYALKTFVGQPELVDGVAKTLVTTGPSMPAPQAAGGFPDVQLKLEGEAACETVIAAYEAPDGKVQAVPPFVWAVLIKVAMRLIEKYVSK